MRSHHPFSVAPRTGRGMGRNNQSRAPLSSQAGEEPGHHRPGRLSHRNEMNFGSRDDHLVHVYRFQCVGNKTNRIGAVDGGPSDREKVLSKNGKVQ